MIKLVLSIVFNVITSTLLFAGQFEPYEIKAGVPYYSDEYTTNNGLSELGEEKNYEEVYQYYNYYEAIFDENKRMVIFSAYERGDIDFSETYYYDGDGRPVKKVVKKSDGSGSVVKF
jgi:hypothetical protein